MPNPYHKRNHYNHYFFIAAAQFLLFFYFMPIVGRIIWPQVLDFLEQNEIPMITFILAGQFIWHTVLMLYNNIHMYIIYKMKHPFFEQYKINDEPWPWESDQEEWNRLFWRGMKLNMFNSLIFLPALLVLRAYAFKWEVKFSTKTEDIPDSFTFFLQVVFNFMIEDLAFHLGHRLAHWRVIYPYIHKIHHEFKVTVSIAAEYSHPLDYLLTSLIPTGMGSNILGRRMHIYSNLCWQMIRIGETVDGHSGYDFPWSPFRLLPLTTTSTYHDYHHLHNVGNYSSVFRTWDTIFGTNKSYYKYLGEVDEKKEK